MGKADSVLLHKYWRSRCAFGYTDIRSEIKRADLKGKYRLRMASQSRIPVKKGQQNLWCGQW